MNIKADQIIDTTSIGPKVCTLEIFTAILRLLIQFITYSIINTNYNTTGGDLQKYQRKRLYLIFAL